MSALQRRTPVRSACVLVAALCLALLAACSKSAPVAHATFEVAEVVPAGTGGALSAPHFDASQPNVLLTTITPFELESTSIQPDSFGEPAIQFEIVHHEQSAFRAWTAARIRKQMALLIDHKVVTVATIESELPGHGIIQFGRNPPSNEELERIAASLAAAK